MSKLNHNFASQLALLLHVRNMLQVDLANLADMSHQQVNDLVLNRHPDLRFSTVVRVATAMGVPTDYFIGEPDGSDR